MTEIERLLGLVVVLMVAYTLFAPEKKEHICVLGIGDCGVKSTSVNETVNKTMTNVMMSNAQSCGASTGVNQMISLSDIDAEGDVTISGIKQDSNLKFDFSCMQTSGNQADLSSKFSDQLKQDMKQTTSGYQFQPSETETVNRAINEITTNIGMSNVANCMANSFTDQTQLIDKIKATGNVKIENLAQTAIQDVTATCLQNNSNVTSAIADIQKVLDSKTDQTAKGVDLFASITSLGTVWIVAIIGCVVISLGVSAISAFSPAATNLTKDPAALKDLIKTGADAVKDVSASLQSGSTSLPTGGLSMGSGLRM